VFQDMRCRQNERYFNLNKLGSELQPKGTPLFGPPKVTPMVTICEIMINRKYQQILSTK